METARIQRGCTATGPRARIGAYGSSCQREREMKNVVALLVILLISVT